jgi:hypothetical protein
MGDRLLQACIDEFGLAAVHVARDPPRISSTANIDQLIKLAPAAAWWVSAAEASALAAASRRRAANQTGVTAIECVTVTASERAVTLTPHSMVLQRAQNLIGRVNKIFEQMKSAGELRTINASYRLKRERNAKRGRATPPFSQFVERYKRDILARVAAEIRANQLPRR